MQGLQGYQIWHLKNLPGNSLIHRFSVLNQSLLNPLISVLRLRYSERKSKGTSKKMSAYCVHIFGLSPQILARVCRDEIQAKVTVKLLWNTNIAPQQKPHTFQHRELTSTHISGQSIVFFFRKDLSCVWLAVDIYVYFASAWNKMRFMPVWAKWHNHAQGTAFMDTIKKCSNGQKLVKE